MTELVIPLTAIAIAFGWLLAPAIRERQGRRETYRWEGPDWRDNAPAWTKPPHQRRGH